MLSHVSAALRAIHHPPTPQRRRRRIAVAVDIADAIEANLPGFRAATIFEQVLEDTCRAHGRFCCERCFATAVPFSATARRHRIGARIAFAAGRMAAAARARVTRRGGR
jgi:hypothetical protein